MTTIIIIFACVVVAFAGIYFIRLIADGGKLKAQLHRRRVEDFERERLMAEPWPPHDDTEETKTWPLIPPGAAA